MANFYIETKKDDIWAEPFINVEYDSYSNEQLLSLGYHRFIPIHNPQPSVKYNSTYEYVLNSDNTVSMSWTNIEKTGDELKIVILQEWNNIRTIRNSLLLESDWTQISDAMISENDKIKWKEYRQKLRDLTTSTDDPFNIVYPKNPNGFAYNTQIGVSRV